MMLLQSVLCLCCLLYLFEVLESTPACEFELESLCGSDIPHSEREIIAARVCLASNLHLVTASCEDFLQKNSQSFIEPCTQSIIKHCKSESYDKSILVDCLLSKSNEDECLQAIRDKSVDDKLIWDEENIINNEQPSESSNFYDLLMSFASSKDYLHSVSIKSATLRGSDQQ